MAKARIETYTTHRQLGRSRIADHYWRCLGCNATDGTPTGFSTERDAKANSLSHRCPG